MNRARVRIAVLLAGVLSMGLISATTEASVVVRMELNYSINTTAGPLNYVDIELFDTAAPITVENFLRYVNGGHYDNTIIHRSMDAFVVQGGGFTPVVQQGTVTRLDPIVNFGPIQNEFSPTRSNVAGTIAMAKVSGDPNSATNQWFFNVGDNSANLDSQNGGFTVFGRVLGNGMELVNAINNLTTYNLASEYGGAFTDVPLFNGGANFVTITKAGVLTPPVVTTGSLSGFVYVDSSSNGVMDGNDYVIAGAKVTLIRQGSSTPIATVYTNADGSYQFNNLPAGSYSIRMETPTFVPGQGSSGSQIVRDGNGNLVSSGTAGTVVQNSFVDIVLDEGHQGLNFNFGQSAYPVALMSARMLLNTATVPQPGVVASTASLSIGSTVDFGNVLVGETANKALVIANSGPAGSELSGVIAGASSPFSPVGFLAFGPLGSGEQVSREYVFAPTQRGANSQNVAVTTNANNRQFTLTGVGVAPVAEIDTSRTDVGPVRIGTTAVGSFTIGNVGDGNRSGLGEISNLRGSVESTSGSFNGSGGAFSLPDSSVHSYEFTFAPQLHADQVGTVVVDLANGKPDGSNQPDHIEFYVYGRGVGPTYSSDIPPNSTLDFGTVPQADFRTLWLSITNTSTDSNGGNPSLTDLTLLGYEIVGPDANLFSIVGFESGAVLHQGDLYVIGISYNGQGEHGERSAWLTIFTDEGAALGESGLSFTYEISASLAPEPGAMALLGTGLLIAGGIAWRRRKARATAD